MSYQQGYSLLELSISLFLFTSLMMGMFSLLLSSRRLNVEVQQYAMASHYAHDMIERMRSNPDVLDAYLGVYQSAGDSSIDCASGCTAEQLAAADLVKWQQQLHGLSTGNQQQTFAVLPEAIACISLNAGEIVLVISWRSANKDDHHDFACGNQQGRLALERRVYIAAFVEDV